MHLGLFGVLFVCLEFLCLWFFGVFLGFCVCVWSCLFVCDFFGGVAFFVWFEFF